MKKDKKLIATSLVLAAMLGTSAFAESRPSNETRRRGDASSTVRRERSTEARRGDASVSRNSGRAPAGRVEARGQSGRGSGSASNDRNRSGQTYERNDRNRSGSAESSRRSDANRGSSESYRRSDGNRSSGSNRNGDNRGNGNWDRNRSGSSRGGNDTYRRGDSRSNGRYDSNRSYGNRQHYQHRGRISNYARYGNGYRVWIVGAPYPFYIPLSYWHRDRFRIGLTIGLGGYYNPGGYYDYYDGYDDGYNRAAASRGELRGVVESVDYRRDTFVVRNDATGSFVTVVMRDRQREVRAGDYVEVSGDWTRSGVFTAYDVDLLDN